MAHFFFKYANEKLVLHKYYYFSSHKLIEIQKYVCTFLNLLKVTFEKWYVNPDWPESFHATSWRCSCVPSRQSQFAIWGRGRAPHWTEYWNTHQHAGYEREPVLSSLTSTRVASSMWAGGCANPRILVHPWEKASVASGSAFQLKNRGRQALIQQSKDLHI